MQNPTETLNYGKTAVNVQLRGGGIDPSELILEIVQDELIIMSAVFFPSNGACYLFKTDSDEVKAILAQRRVEAEADALEYPNP